MRTLSLLVALFAASGMAATAAGVDLTKIDRAIGKEPAYKGKPKYCLLVFGAEAKHRAWVVVDDEAVHVDRNGNGDLTERGKRVSLKEGSTGYFEAGDLTFDKGKVDEVRYSNLTLAGGKYWTLEVNGAHRQRVNRDAQGELTFSLRPQDAPIIHFDGPLVVELLNYCKTNKTQALVRGSKPVFLTASLGTPGLGKGTFAYLLPPKNVKALKPLMEVEFAHRDPKEKPIVVKLRMEIVDEDCVSFDAAVSVPDHAAGDTAKVSLSFADWKEGMVASRSSEVAITEPKPAGKLLKTPK